MISKKLSIVHCQLSIILAFLPLSVAYAQQDLSLIHILRMILESRERLRRAHEECAKLESVI